MARRSPMTKLTHSFTDFPFGLFVSLGLAAVPLLFALGEGDFAFGDAVAEVDAQGDERQAFAIRFARQFFDLFLAQEQLARAQGPVIPRASREIFADMESRRLALPSRRDLTSVPSNTIPASSFSRR
jgi:hypothetical protein